MKNCVWVQPMQVPNFTDAFAKDPGGDASGISTPRPMVPMLFVVTASMCHVVDHMKRGMIVPAVRAESGHIRRGMTVHVSAQRAGTSREA